MKNPKPPPPDTPYAAGQQAGVFVSKGALAVGFITVGAAVVTSYKLGGRDFELKSVQGGALFGIAAGALDNASRSVIHGIDATTDEVANFVSVKGFAIENLITEKSPGLLDKTLSAGAEGMKCLSGLYAGTTGMKCFRHIAKVASGKKTAENGARAIVDEHAKALKKTAAAIKRCRILLKENRWQSPAMAWP